MIRTVIADDHELIRDGFGKLLSTEPDIVLVGKAESAAELYDLLYAVEADILVLDLNLPDRDGMDVLKDLQRIRPELKVLILSMHPEERFAQRALKNGAAGYLTKDAASEELVRAIRKISVTGKYISETLAEELSLTFGRERTDAPHTALSDRELQVLLLLGEGKKITEIAGILGLSINTVNSYRRRLLEKLRLASTADCIKYVFEHGLNS